MENWMRREKERKKKTSKFYWNIFVRLSEQIFTDTTWVWWNSVAHDCPNFRVVPDFHNCLLPVHRTTSTGTRTHYFAQPNWYYCYLPRRPDKKERNGALLFVSVLYRNDSFKMARHTENLRNECGHRRRHCMWCSLVETSIFSSSRGNHFIFPKEILFSSSFSFFFIFFFFSVVCGLLARFHFHSSIRRVCAPHMHTSKSNIILDTLFYFLFHFGWIEIRLQAIFILELLLCICLSLSLSLRLPLSLSIYLCIHGPIASHVTCAMCVWVAWKLRVFVCERCTERNIDYMTLYSFQKRDVYVRMLASVRIHKAKGTHVIAVPLFNPSSQRVFGCMLYVCMSVSVSDGIACSAPLTMYTIVVRSHTLTHSKLI